MGFNKAAGDEISAAEFNSFIASAGLYGASATGNDSYAITVTPVPNDYDAGDTYTFKADVGNTGACTLNVNSLGAKTIKKFGTQDLSTGDIIAGQMVTVVYDGTYFQIASEARPVPYFQQQISLASTFDTQTDFAAGSNQDGSVFYIAIGGSDDLMARFERDSLTGMYFRTHQVSLTAQISNCHGIVQVGSYIYLFYENAGNVACKRFVAADLTSESAMTMPATLATTNSVEWTDGTYVYVILSNTNTTCRKWSISGTTFAAVGTSTVTNDFDGAAITTTFDGTRAYHIKAGSSTITIRKITTIDGTAYSDTVVNFSPYESNPSWIFGIIIDATKMYIGRGYDNNNATAVAARLIHLLPVTKP